MHENYVVIEKGTSLDEIVRRAAHVNPSTRQYEWQKLEFIAFIHFGINTFTGREWGMGSEDISIFNPAELDVTQWVNVCREAGMKMIILTAKHHDGFCLWPSAYTDHSIANTPYRNGTGDIVRELSDACREAGLKFGIYLSPWDRHEPSYGDSPAYNQFFRNQLTELLTNYGEITEVWFDGASGEGPDGKQQIYDWPSYYRVIRELQPKAVIAVMGPDVRWIGAESGYGRDTEWSVLPGSYMDVDQIAASSQQDITDGAFIPGDLTDQDLGSREILKDVSSLIWHPAEADVSIRPGWFYRQIEDERVKTPEELVDIYFNSVGKNAVLLLNLPPDKRGLIHENDIRSLQGMRHLLDETFKINYIDQASVNASNAKPGHSARQIIDGDENTWWMTDDGVESGWIEFDLIREQTFDRAMLQERILTGQRIEKFHLEYWAENKWHRFADGTTVGYKRLPQFPAVTARKIRLVIEESRTSPTLTAFGLYKAPPEITFKPEESAFKDSIQVEIECDFENAVIYYTLNGGQATEASKIYSGPILLKQNATLSVLTVSVDGKKSFPVTKRYIKTEFGINVKSAFNPWYAAGGTLALVDGLLGSTDFRDGKWQGYDGIDFDAVIDLGRVKELTHVSARFQQDTGSWLFMPRFVSYEISTDGKNFIPAGRVNNDIPDRHDEPVIKAFEIALDNAAARYIRVHAKSIGTCPEWHPGAGDKAWLFIDEIIVE